MFCGYIRRPSIESDNSMPDPVLLLKLTFSNISLDRFGETDILLNPAKL